MTLFIKGVYFDKPARVTDPLHKFSRSLARFNELS